MLAVYLGLTFHLSGQARPPAHPQTAVWLAHRWAGQPQPASAYRRLFGQLRADRVTYAFLHVGPLAAAGTIPSRRYRAAAGFLAAAASLDPRLAVLAWVGQIIRPSGPLDLDSPPVRARIVATDRALLRLGFAGIHYDLEPVPSGDQGYLDLLAATRPVTATAGRLLSAATPALDAEPIEGLLSDLAPGYVTWSASYYRQVAGLVDQVAVMTYGKELPVSWAYGSFVRWQTRDIAALMPPGTSLLIGVPTYNVTGWNLFPRAETLAAGLRGVREALPRAPHHVIVGVAVYADWTTTATDWRLLRVQWSR